MTTFKTNAATLATNGISGKSPNVPFASYEFIANAEGDDVAIVKSRNKANTADVEHYEVRPAGATDGRRRRVYMSALSSPEAIAIVTDPTTKQMLRTVAFGIYRKIDAVTGDSVSVVSTNEEEVTQGIAAAAESYSLSLKVKSAEKAQALVAGYSVS